MARIHELIRQVARTNADLAEELQREADALASRRSFGLNFERHVPEAVDLPGRPVRRNDKVRILPPRGFSAPSENDRVWRVASIETVATQKIAHLESLDEQRDVATFPVEDLVVIAEFRDPIYPGLVSTGKVQRGHDKPFHTVINGENYHALEALLFTNRGKVDAIYIDPPYNTGSKDWKYNNNYVESDDLYRHSKWLAFMERRLKLAKELLNPASSGLVVTIDEKEYLRLGLLLEQIFPNARIQMVTSVISSQGSVRDGMFTRADEYLFFVLQGDLAIAKSSDDMLNEGQSETKSQLWFQFVRTGKGNLRSDSKNLFYPLFVSDVDGSIHSIGDPIPLGQDKSLTQPPDGTAAIWPISAAGEEARWRTGVDVARRRAAKGVLRASKSTSARANKWSIMTVNQGTEDRIDSGEIVIESIAANGAAQLVEVMHSELRSPKTTWNKTSHNAGWHGSKLLASLLPTRKFPYPKSLYAVEDTLRFLVANKQNSVILDFFAGSGTTAHAVMRLNKQDGGSRRSISITNNEVSSDEQKQLRNSGLRPGDGDWEKWGICDYITKPRIEAAITGKTTDGAEVKGDYKFTDEFPMSDGFEENVEFFTLTYEAPLRVESNREFAKIAPILWMRAGSSGRRIQDLSNGWDVAETYGVIANFDETEPYLDALAKAPDLNLVFIVTDEDRIFESMVRDLPEHVEPVRLYESYLRNFEIDAARTTR
jgi:adenine-specific DNA-methyltransferase